nr:hypothetical protein Iba_chr04fCG8170 [Ipomoea batatas]
MSREELEAGTGKEAAEFGKLSSACDLGSRISDTHFPLLFRRLTPLYAAPLLSLLLLQALVDILESLCDRCGRRDDYEWSGMVKRRPFKKVEEIRAKCKPVGDDRSRIMD